MRHFTLATVLAAAAVLSVGAAQAAPGGGADFGGPATDGKGMCRQYNNNSGNVSFWYWDACPGHEPRKGGVGVRTIRVTHHAKKEG